MVDNPYRHALIHQQEDKDSMKSRQELYQELRRRILSLPGVTQRQNAGIHEDAFFVGRTMFMHIHGQQHCDILLATSDQIRVLTQGDARPHRWAPEKGYVTFMTRDENDLAPAMDLIRMSHHHFADQRDE
jgi:Luciferase